jgi:hypothetical protein
MSIAYARPARVGKLQIESPPIQFELDLPRIRDRKPLPPEIERLLFGPVEYASGLPTAFLEGRWP